MVSMVLLFCSWYFSVLVLKSSDSGMVMVLICCSVMWVMVVLKCCGSMMVMWWLCFMFWVSSVLDRWLVVCCSWV